MESFFFNITDTRYKISEIFKASEERITRVDISNGVVFLDVCVNLPKSFHIKNLDRMVMISVVKRGSLNICDNSTKHTFQAKDGNIDIYCSSRQDLTLEFGQEGESDVFILFVADFFLKRYLTSNINEPIDFLYNKIQSEISLELINRQSTDALSLYIVDKIINARLNSSMNGIRCEHSVIEFLIHRLSLCDMIIENISSEELDISSRAKDILLQNFSNPPTIQALAHLCATNESKLKKVFKKAYQSTIYNYIQKLRLEEANILLKERALTIGQISKKVGYKHQGHFSKLFFETYGIYPKNLLKK